MLLKPEENTDSTPCTSAYTNGPFEVHGYLSYYLYLKAGISLILNSL